MVSILDHIPEDQFLHDKILDQQNKINECEAKFFKLTEEKVKMNENLREMSSSLWRPEKREGCDLRKFQENA